MEINEGGWGIIKVSKMRGENKYNNKQEVENFQNKCTWLIGFLDEDETCNRIELQFN